MRVRYQVLFIERSKTRTLKTQKSPYPRLRRPATVRTLISKSTLGCIMKSPSLIGYRKSHHTLSFQRNTFDRYFLMKIFTSRINRANRPSQFRTRTQLLSVNCPVEGKPGKCRYMSVKCCTVADTLSGSRTLTMSFTGTWQPNMRGIIRQDYFIFCSYLHQRKI